MIKLRIENHVTGIYAIEIPSIKYAYIGQSINVRNRINQHRCVFRSGKAKNKEFQAAWDKYENEIEYKLVKECKVCLREEETEACKMYLQQGWKLFNAVIETQTNIFNASQEYIPCLKQVVRALERKKITPQELIRQLELL
jgi:hypothetical protein